MLCKSLAVMILVAGVEVSKSLLEKAQLRGVGQQGGGFASIAGWQWGRRKGGNR